MQSDQPLSDEDGQACAEGREDEQPHRQFPRNHPQHPEESAERHHRVDRGEQIAEHAGGERFDILRDSLVRVVHPVRAAQAVIGAVEKVALHQQVRHPLPPQEREALGGVAVEDADRNREGESGKVDPQVAVEAGRITLREGGDKIPPRVAHKHLDHADRQTKREHGEHQHPGFAPVPGDEKRLRKLDKPPENTDVRGRVAWSGFCLTTHVVKLFQGEPAFRRSVVLRGATRSRRRGRRHRQPAR